MPSCPFQQALLQVVLRLKFENYLPGSGEGLACSAKLPFSLQIPSETWVRGWPPHCWGHTGRAAIPGLEGFLPALSQQVGRPGACRCEQQHSPGQEGSQPLKALL